MSLYLDYLDILQCPAPGLHHVKEEMSGCGISGTHHLILEIFWFGDQAVS